MAEDKPDKATGIKARLQAARDRYPFLDHLINMVEHYNKVEGNVLAGAATYFGFLSFFPILALAFAVVGYVSVYYSDAQGNLVTAIEQIFPGIVSQDDQPGKISLSQIEGAKAAAGIIGFLGVLYSGLNWISGLRTALQNAFEIPSDKKGNFFVGKGIDLMALAVIGVILIVSVGIAGVVQGLGGTILAWLGLDATLIGPPLIWLVAVLLGIASSTVLFFVMYKLLGRPHIPKKVILQGAFFGAAGFEALKMIVVKVLGGVGGSDFAPLAIAITLLVWINYFSRLVVYGASWAMTSPHAYEAVTRRTDASLAAVVRADFADEEARVTPAAAMALRDGHAGPAGRFDAGSAALGAAAALVAAALFGRRD
ncbi:MAG: YihY/virulence factor BrkB family protein [Nocardioidaceae bacterium]|nr:YihY/virulence factor BrkB family protein [Nocardioidaceae bacterium]